LTILEKLDNASQAVQWTDNIPTKYLYSYGIAGERFFREIKNNGRLMAAVCTKCNLTYLPPRLYCEECFEKLEKWTALKPAGHVSSYTVLHVHSDGRRLQEPKIIALIKFDRVKGGMIHLLGNMGRRKAVIGMNVQPKFKPKAQRNGLMTDIEYFEPA
jgi:uncharacterized OB-fold protein